MSEGRIRPALAEHLEAYGQLLSAATHRWSGQLVRRVLGLVVAAICGLFALLIAAFIAILAGWPTPWRWWVVAGVALPFVAGILWGIVVSNRAARESPDPPWEVLAQELAIDLRGPASGAEQDDADAGRRDK
jgi:hypothetical protein